MGPYYVVIFLQNKSLLHDQHLVFSEHTPNNSDN